VERYGDVDRQMKKVRIDGMQFQADEIATNTIVTQIKVLCENADVYKATMGEAKYNEQLVALINKMPGMTPTTPTTSTTVDAPNDENDDEENENSSGGENSEKIILWGWGTSIDINYINNFNHNSSLFWKSPYFTKDA
jgi:hypothetical protein